MDEAEKLLLEEKERLSMLRKRREERLRNEKQEFGPEAREENNSDRYRDLREDGVLRTVPAAEVAEEAAKAEEANEAEKEEITPPARTSASSSPSSSSKLPKKASKSKPSGAPVLKVLVFGAVFCLLLFGTWAFIGGTEVGVGDAEGTGQDYEALADASPKPSPISSGTSPEIAPPEKAKDLPGSPLNPAKSFTNSLGMEFVLVPAGEFLMGSPETEAGRQPDESSVHAVRLDKPFYLGKYEVTREQWYEVMGMPGEVEVEVEVPLPGDSELPVAEVSWDDAQEFAKKLNELEGTDKYRLPSEAEWEYACRAGSSTKYSVGDSKSELVKCAWFGKSPGSAPHPVGQKAPNAWGLYDMHGNVWEWVQDSWHNDYNGAPSDGKAWESGDISHRVARGGSVTGSAESCRDANRAWFGSDVRNADMGFRLLMEA